MRRATTVGAEYAEPIRKAADDFADHEGVDAARVLRWMIQFADGDLPLAEKILANIRFFTRNNIRGMTRDLFNMVVGTVGLDPDRVVFVPMARVAGGGVDTIARALGAIKQPRTPRVSSMADLERLPPEDVDAVVFLDDFGGSGDTLTDWWQTVESLVRPLGARVLFAALVMTGIAIQRAEQFAEAMPVEALGEGEDVFSEANRVFDAGEKRKLLAYCRATGCPPKFVRGYGDAGLLVAFAHSCPNNSVPVLWFDGKSWDRLFLRRAL